MPLPARDIKLYRIPRGATKKHHTGSYRHVQAIKFHCAVLRASVSRTGEAIVVAQTFMGLQPPGRINVAGKRLSCGQTAQKPRGLVAAAVFLFQHV